jgi:hypothetical protein
VFPIRLTNHGYIEIRWRKRWVTVPSSITAVTISVIGLGLIWAVVNGPALIAIPAVMVLIVPSAIFVGALIWIVGKSSASAGFVLAILLFALEAFGIRWPDGEPLQGSWFGTIVAAICAIAAFFGLLRRPSSPN